MKKTIPFYIIIFSIFLSVISFELFSDGMFFDGVYYANFSKVMGLNFSGFWSLKDCISCEKLFGHPPLAIFMESLIFKAFGDSIFVERFYSLFTYLFSAVIIHFVFSEILPNSKKMSWVALLLWIVIPVVTWGASNNMLENTMTIFVLLSTLYILKSLKKATFKNLLIASVFLFLGFLTKGFVALFPLSILMVFYLVFKDKKLNQTIINSLFLLSSLLFLFVLLYAFDKEGWDYLVTYFDVQLIQAMKNEHTVSSRFMIVFWLFNELLPPIIIVGLVIFFTRKSVQFKKNSIEFKWFLAFVLIGLTGVIPMIISLKQSRFYILSSLPFFSLGLSFLFIKNIHFLFDYYYNKKAQKIFKTLSLLLVLISFSIAFLQKDKISRDTEKITDVYEIIKIVGKENTLTIPHELFWDWSLKSYFYRYGGVGLSSDQDKLNEFLVIGKNKNDDLKNNYELIDDNLSIYNLYKLKKE